MKNPESAISKTREFIVERGDFVLHVHGVCYGKRVQRPPKNLRAEVLHGT